MRASLASGIPQRPLGIPQRSDSLTVVDDATAARWGARTFPRVLAIVLGQPEREFALAELVEGTGADRESVHRALRRAMAARLLIRRRVGAQFLYSADPGSPVLAEMSALAAKTHGLQRLLGDALLQAGAPAVESAFIFGSQAAGRAKAGSDVDVMVVGSATRFELADLLKDVKDRIDRPVN